MKRQLWIGVLIGMVIISGCGSGVLKKEILAKVNNYEITKDRFEQEFKESAYAGTDTLESRKEFLGNLIDRKLILQEAQAKGLDKEPEFLRMIEKFWEQSLLKLALDKKTQEIAGAAAAGSARIRGQSNNEATRSEESQAINDWVAGLHKSAQIEVNADLLKQ